jgi:hypothetical protein
MLMGFVSARSEFSVAPFSYTNGQVAKEGKGDRQAL